MPISDKNPAHRLSSRAITSLLLSAATGCVSNPYIANSRPENSATYSGSVGSPNKRGTLEYAVAYADSTYEAYAAKLPEEFSRQQNLSTGLFALGGLGVGLAAGGAHSDAIKLTALAAGLTYQLGTWNSNQGRLGFYLEGMKALSCAKAAIGPLRINATRLKQIDKIQSDAQEALADAANAAADVMGSLGAIPSDDPNIGKISQTAATNLAEFNADASQANIVIARASSLQNKVENAGNILDAKVDEIRRIVDTSIRNTEADPSQLPKAIASLSDYVNIFAPGLNIGAALPQVIAGGVKKDLAGAGAAKPEGGGPATAIGGLASAMGKLHAKRVVLAARIAALSNAAETGSMDQIKASLAGCGFDVKATVTLALKPASVSFEAGKEGTAIVTISGGTLPYSATPLDSLSTDISYNVIPTGAIILTASTRATGGKSYRFSITDSVGSPQILSVTVLPKAEPAHSTDVRTRKPREQAAGRVANDCATTNSKVQICLVQHALGIPTSGSMDQDMCTKIEKTVPAVGRRYNDKVVEWAFSQNALKEFQLSVNAQQDKLEKAAKSLNLSCVK